MLEPISYTIEVPCSQQKAFGVFVDEMTTWWPLDTRSVSAMGGEVARSVSVDPRPGGKIVEIGHDGAEQLWGTVMCYDPHDAFSMDFHMGLPPGDSASVVEVRFTALGDERMRVVLTHSNWEAYGELAEMMPGGYGSSWVMIFEEQYKAACGG